MLGFSSTDSADGLSDEDILLRSQSHPWLFAVLLDRYQAAFMRKAMSILHRPPDAEEVVQDTFTKIYLNAGRFETQAGAKFSSWAYRILVNTAFTRYQKLKKEGERFVAIPPEFEELIGDRMLHSGFEEQNDAIERILHRIPGHFAAVLRLHYLEHWSQEDIAAAYGVQTGTIKARIHRAKTAFRKEAGRQQFIEVTSSKGK